MKHTELTIKVPPIPTPDNRSVLFLDFDDVLCLNIPYGGYDVIAALSKVQKKTAALEDFAALWAQLFDPQACSLLGKLDAEFAPLYVLSTSWRMFMNRDALVAVLVNTGLEFVARNLHEKWQTPDFLSPQLRAREIGFWRGYKQNKNWVVLDDERSGTGFGEDYPFKENLPFIVLCQEGRGLGLLEYEKLRTAFELRGSINDLQLGGRTP